MQTAHDLDCFNVDRVKGQLRAGGFRSQGGAWVDDGSLAGHHTWYFNSQDQGKAIAPWPGNVWPVR
jgi:hypothetical protein